MDRYCVCPFLGTYQGTPCVKVHHHMMNRESNWKSLHSKSEIFSCTCFGTKPPCLRKKPGLLFCTWSTWSSVHTLLKNFLSGGCPIGKFHFWTQDFHRRKQGLLTLVVWACCHSSVCLLVVHPSYSLIGGIPLYMNTLFLFLFFQWLFMNAYTAVAALMLQHFYHNYTVHW